MIKVIETNLSIDDDNNIKDHQSRIIEIESWENYIDEIKETKTVVRKAYVGSMDGTTIPKEAKIENFTHDDFHLSCDVYNYLGCKSKKLVYVIK